MGEVQDKPVQPQARTHPAAMEDPILLRDQELGISSIPGTSSQRTNFGGEENISEPAVAAIFSSRLVGGDVMCQSLGHGHIARSGASATSQKSPGSSPNFWRFSQQQEEAKIAFLLIYELWICWIWPTGPLRDYKFAI